ncbi:MAG: OmpA family protein [Myxococcota bacterium]|nr:OmpA family protein [Myxococcota bacterium]
MKKQTNFLARNGMRSVGRLVLGLAALMFGVVAVALPVAADGPSVTDLSDVEVNVIESGDIVEALAVTRGIRVRASARPRVRLPVDFAFNSVELKPEAKALLEKVGRALTAPDLETFRFSIEGHTDSIGGEDFNTNLSKRRAEVVQDYLTNTGVDQMRLESIGLGEASPVDTNVTDEGRQHNRRVEIINLGTES